MVNAGYEHGFYLIHIKDNEPADYSLIGTGFCWMGNTPKGSLLYKKSARFLAGYLFSKLLGMGSKREKDGRC